MNERFETFAAAITQISRCIQRLKRAEMTELGLRGNHAMCLFYLGKHPEGLTGGQLAERCEEDKAAVSRAVAELEEAGLVHCDAPEGKKRYRARIFLTEAGTDLAAAVAERVEAILEQVGGALPEETRRIFYETLTCIAGNLQALCEGKTDAPGAAGEP